MATHSRPRWLAAVLVVMLSTLGFLAGGVTGAHAAQATVTGGELDWGVKTSFRNYISGPIAHGTITTTDGAATNPDGTFRFTAGRGTVDVEAGTAELSFDGKVEFTGHETASGPLLALTISDLRLRLDGASGVLVADVVSKSLSSGDYVTYDDVELGDLAGVDLAGTDVVSADGVGVTLTEAGVPAFADFYSAGTELDPARFSVTTEPETQWQPGIEVGKTTGIDPAGETITVSGSGFDPAANAGTRPPLAGQPTGVYLVFAKLADPWRPSEGAPSAARTVLDQKWVLPAASRAILDPAGTNPDYVELGSDGSFTGSLDVAAVSEGADCTVETCAVITYAAGGAVNAAHEIAVPLTFATESTETTEPTQPTEPTEPTEPTQPTTPTDPAQSPSGVVTSARLDWGIKESFRNYVRGPIAHGSWSLDGVGGTGPFHWTELNNATFDQTGPDGLLDFAGSIRFTGHEQNGAPLLDLTVSQPQVRITDGNAELLLDVRSKGLDTPDYIELDDVVFATLDLSSVSPDVQNGVVTYSAVPATLTEQGAQGFAGFYEAGTELDTVSFTVALDGASLPPAASGGDASGPGNGAPLTGASNGGGLAYTGGNVWPLAALGGVLVLAGTGLLVVRRRGSRAELVRG
ncbi:HtaA domain-containing protein [Saccharomonospora sp. NPDC046836]|uniref:HtaA domain-containing protein n=1 Tax=Saccharomonospora sp. NPDC046836 TaxID=3156921 RepID=UPI0033E746EC